MPNHAMPAHCPNFAESPPCHPSGGLQIRRDGLGLDLVLGQGQGVCSQARDRGPQVVKLGGRLEAGQLRGAIRSGCRFHPVNQCVGEPHESVTRLPPTDHERRQADASKRPAVTAAERERPPSGCVQGEVEFRRGREFRGHRESSGDTIPIGWEVASHLPIEHRFGSRLQIPGCQVGPRCCELPGSERAGKPEAARTGSLGGGDARDGVLDHQAGRWLQAEPAGGFEEDVGGTPHSL